MVRHFGDWLRSIFPWFFRHYNGLEVRGVENLPAQGSAIIASNHSGGMDLDNFCLMSALEHVKTSNPARKRIWLCYWDKWSAEDNSWARFVRKFSPIPISLTGGGIPYRLVDRIVERGELLAIMPEGHSASLREGYRLWKFYPGVIKLHARYGIPIIPTASIGFVKASPIISNQYNPKKVPPWEKEVMVPFILPKKLIIHFGEPLTLVKHLDGDLSKQKMFQLASKVREKVAEMISLYKNEVR